MFLMKKLTLKFSLIAHIQYFIIFIKNIKMRNSLLKYLPFIFLFIFSACEIENEMTDDELIEAIINSNEKVKILETDLPLDAKNSPSMNWRLNILKIKTIELITRKKYIK